MKITIAPAIKPEFRHILQKALAEVVGGVARIDGGGTNMDGTSCDIFLVPKEGFTEADIRTVLVGRPEHPPWLLPELPLSNEIPIV